MGRRLLHTIWVTITALGILVLMSLPANVQVLAQTCAPNTQTMSIQQGADCARGNGQATNLVGGNNGIFSRITNILLFIVGAVAVIMLIIGGIRYVISGGDQSRVTAAKNTILYAIVGLVVAFLSYAAISFVTRALTGVST